MAQAAESCLAGARWTAHEYDVFPVHDGAGMHDAAAQMRQARGDNRPVVRMVPDWFVASAMCGQKTRAEILRESGDVPPVSG